MRRDAVGELYERYAPMVYKYLLCLCHEEGLAEDLTADTFEAALKGIGRFRQEAKISVWLCAIAKRLYYQELRKRGRIRHVPLDAEPLVSETDIEQEYADKADRIDFYRQLRTLDAEAREVFYLRLTGDMTFEEIGEIMGRSGSWARVTFYRGKEKLRKGREQNGD